MEKEIVNEIAESCINLYKKLPKTGKPVDKEWTVLSCIVKYEDQSKNFEVVSLGTGTKCIGATKLSPFGDIMNDSHAEVFARRGFLLYLYDNIERCIEKKESIFTIENYKFKLKDTVSFIFYSSQLPCGDASIIPKDGDSDLFGDLINSAKRPAEDEICDIKKKVPKVEDIHRTGAKCLMGCQDQDPKLPGKNYHLPGQVRTKPGRGDRTLSVSCSDKMAKWIHLGLQGSLLDMVLLEPIYLKYIIFGAGVPFCKEALHRALLNRHCNTISQLAPQIIPLFYQCAVPFEELKNEDKIRPAPGSIVWVNTIESKTEVAVLGKKLGATKKKCGSKSSTPCISKYNLYRRFRGILSKSEILKEQILGPEALENISYNKMKSKSTNYLAKWNVLKEDFFKNWTCKPDMWNFCVSE